MDLRKSFTIDQTLGRDVEVTVDFTPDGSVSELDLYTFDGTLVTSAKPLSGYKTVVLKYGKLEVSLETCGLIFSSLPSLISAWNLHL